MSEVLMECGHVASGTDENGPACAICIGINPGAVIVKQAMPGFTDRYARCSCGTIEKSSLSLAFFEFRGEGSRQAIESCKNCGYSLVAHTQEQTRTQKNVVLRGECPGFEAKGAWEYDGFYCGHGGWD